MDKNEKKSGKKNEKNCTKIKVNSSWKNPLVGCEVSRREGGGERERERERGGGRTQS
jgi:hypothetical protein